MSKEEFDRQKFKEIMARADETIKEAKAILDQNGVVYNLGEWLTVKRYCDRFGIPNTQTVTNWIARGIIPPENVVEIAELNNIRLIKAIKYLD
ncbi:helix-turn-helix domain-containing protein [Runella sp.]|uniref:helix-turn-helix domain-containing protein n=1 Tax=Runella sp. TaxID=1960881 RepID=UPI003D11D1A0